MIRIATPHLATFRYRNQSPQKKPPATTSFRRISILKRATRIAALCPSGQIFARPDNLPRTLVYMVVCRQAVGDPGFCPGLKTLR
jgi:hypothetical protein